MVDMVVPRKELRGVLANLCRLLTKAEPTLAQLAEPPRQALPAPSDA
jgi:acetyl-CoA carboxylase beta subunit